MPPQRPANPDVIFVPGCPSRWFGDIGGSSYVSDLLILAKRAGLNVYVADSRDLCCGQPLDSNGLRESARSKAQESLYSIERVVPEKSVPLVSDVSSCGHAWEEHCKSAGRPVLTPVAFLRDMLLPKLRVTNTLDRCVVHPGCGTITSGDQQALVDVLSAVAKRVTIPQNASCCGMAGAHGLRYPEVVTAALSKERREVQAIDADVFVTLNPLCQSALHKETEITWDSVWSVVERCTR